MVSAADQTAMQEPHRLLGHNDAIKNGRTIGTSGAARTLAGLLAGLYRVEEEAVGAVGFIDRLEAHRLIEASRVGFERAKANTVEPCLSEL